MNLEIAALTLASAVLHPIWNVLVKRAASPERSFLSLATVLSALGLCHALLTGADLWAALRLWPVLALSYLGQLVYGTALVATLKRGDLSEYYPIVRASPLFIVAVGFLVLGERYPPPLLAGVALVVIGGFALQYRRGSHLLSEPLTLGLALLAMSGVGVYSLADGRLMQEIEPSVLMFWVQGAFALTYGLYVRHMAKSETHRFTWWQGWRRIDRLLLPGALSYASYYLILLAFQLGGDVAAVTAVRQASIPISVLLAGMYLREGAILRRLIASGVLAAGIVAIVTAGRL